ncbi:MAG TPA: nucleoside recognition domain-containing protein [Bacillota bacterium]
MLNFIWLLMLVVGVAVAGAGGRIDLVTGAVTDATKQAVDLAIGFVGAMSLWLGLMKVAEKGGLIQSLGRALRPLARWLFPTLDPDGPAVGMVLMNMSANFLGLGNAATPFGLRAMEELQKLNPDKATASDAMCTFLAVNTSAITLVPVMLLALRAALGSTDPTAVVAPCFLATVVSAVVSVTADRLFRAASRRRGR